ncbi:MAG: class I SAM-dependent methyltransferase [Actinomycetota bacterium]
MSLHTDVADHYGQDGLADRIEAGFREAGQDPAALTVDDLAVVDEFHSGGRPATEYLFDLLDLPMGASLLDIGCGVGGPARYAAAHRGLTVTGVDLTPSYIEVARRLTGWVDLDDRVSFRTIADGPLPLDDHTFDGASLLHVGMNVADKTALFAELARVLRPGGRLAVYDLLAAEGAEVSPEFPLPWASTPATSFLEPVEAYRRALVDGGFEVTAIDDRTAAVQAFMAAVAARAAEQDGPPPVGLHLLMGPDAPIKLGNMIAALNARALAPTMLIAEVAAS